MTTDPPSRGGGDDDDDDYKFARNLILEKKQIR